ncbi:MAG: phosphatase PAP2 family protein [Lachnospiraceae bacterium]|jgi:undecaprenyl-diphosphatase|nr:phosphatase PAP2 family protein [Lachnospiraceae bacterium]
MFTLIQDLDWSVLRWIHGTLSCGFLDVVMPAVSRMGDLGAIWILTALLMLFSKKHRRCGLILLIALGLCFVIGNQFLKPLIARSRPCWIDTGVRLLIPNETDYSFPSGHTLASFAAATVIFRMDRKGGAAAYLLAFLIAFSRLYLYVHFPSDILGGILIGLLIGHLALALASLPGAISCRFGTHIQ